MMQKHGVLLYTPADAEKNKWFIEQLCMYAESEGLSLRLCLVSGQSPFYVFSEDTSFCINRSRLYAYSDFAENVLHIPCFNSARVTGLTNEKYLTYAVLHGEYGIPMAKTQQIGKHESLPRLDYPLVAKPADGHGGAGVEWISGLAELAQYHERFYAANPEPTYPFLVQEPVVTGWDVRVYMLGGRPYAAVLRTSETDFRSNFSLGGKAELFEPDAEMQALLERVNSAIYLDFAGVDILKTDGGDYLLGEIEDAVGCRMLYSLTALNPVMDFVSHLAKRLRGGGSGA